MKNYNYLFKYIIVGSTRKSCLLLQYVDQKFRDAHQITMGVEFGTNIIKYNSHIIKLHIWDTAGQESFQSMIRSYYRNAIGCILVFDLTDRKSFESLIRWHNEVLACSGNDIQIIIVGNKHDLQNKREVQEKEALELAKQFNANYIETSALNGLNVVQIFENLTSQILQEIQSGKIDPQNEIYGIKIGDFEKRRNSLVVHKSQRPSVQVSYPIQQQKWECC
ncbi:unnamed protein product [Paramecium pentaurelia]|uniref:Uncharacterized protein n=1 Tax=Paramecium pentaurelia TaxID=43138 RepID=A0A8S1UUV9_9CILI|nr:unnamed protein product [Paramecium pentaurelia]